MNRQSALTTTANGLGLRLQMLAHIQVAATQHTMSLRMAMTRIAKDMSHMSEISDFPGVDLTSHL